VAATAGIVIVGGGLAGAKAAETLRVEGYEGPVHLVGGEQDRPYERPPLSKDYLMGKAERDTVFVHEPGWYAAHDVDLKLGTWVDGLDVDAHTVHLEDGPDLPYDQLLLATGSSPRKLEVPGNDLRGVHYLRRLFQSERLGKDLGEGGRRVVLVGGGWIGLEVAAAARARGDEVTIIEPQPTFLNAALGDELGEVFTDLHREHGVDVRVREGVKELSGSDGQVSSVTTTSGEVIPADVVVVGVGARPNVAFAERAGLEVDNGVLVDATLRSSHPDVYAAGDIANAFNPLYGRRLRVEHWANALNGGPAAARSMLGQDVSYDRAPYFYTDQYDLGMELTGLVAADAFDRVVVRGDKQAREFIAFWLHDGRVMAGMNVNVWDVTDPIQMLIRSGATVDVNRLTDLDLPLAEVLG
jgi:3-phenylpropionate/trans-cinnamate dioxygenase ferredoxin reductase component